MKPTYFQSVSMFKMYQLHLLFLPYLSAMIRKKYHLIAYLEELRNLCLFTYSKRQAQLLEYSLMNMLEDVT